MRLFETILSISNILTFFILVIPKIRAFPGARYIALISLSIAAAQMMLEGPRWQMVPAYFLSALFFLTDLPRGGKTLSEVRNHNHALRIAVPMAIGLGGLVMAGSTILPIIFPISRFPHPTGLYEIGTLTYDWVDMSRQEIFTTDPSAHRELMVQIWYPAKANPSAPRTPYIQDSRTLVPLARLLHLPDFIFDHLKYVTTNAIVSAPAADQGTSYPVLIFSHGRGGYRQQNTLEIEELVSHGYIVAAIDHTYAASGVVFPDGRLVSLDPRMLDRPYVDGKISYLAQDVSFVINQLSMLNERDPNGILTGLLDIHQMGVFGLSLGGEITAKACQHDPRIRACLMMDVWMPVDVVRDGLQQPALWISRDAGTMQLEGWSQADIEETLTSMRAVYNNLPGDGYFLLVPGMFHQDFSDASLLSPLTSWMGITGSINSQRAHTIVNAYSLAFFDRYLKGYQSALLNDSDRPFAEVIFEKRR